MEFANNRVLQLLILMLMISAELVLLPVQAVTLLNRTQDAV